MLLAWKKGEKFRCFQEMNKALCVLNVKYIACIVTRLLEISSGKFTLIVIFTVYLFFYLDTPEFMGVVND